jgi:TolB-like protein/tetratricopeptide (TPR) repeat protein
MLGGLGSFGAELRRRHVIRVALAYCAVGWAVAEVSSTLAPALDMPAWSVSLVVMLLVLGFPVALVLAWAFDLTPAGVKRTPALPSLPLRDPSSPPAILALPFVDRSVGADHQYLGDGITEELINSLARVPLLRVVSRTSAFALRSAATDLREIGARLGVSHVVEGSVGVASGRIRLTVQLVSVSNGYAIWSRTFERPLDNVFSVQEEIAGALVSALQPTLLDTTAAPQPEQEAPADRPVDFTTYALYLRGRQQWNERTPASLRRALDFFTQATEQDPLYARAHAGIADCWAILVDHGITAPEEGLPAARQAAAAALRLAPGLPEPHASSALIAQLEWRQSDAEAGFRAALDLCPGYVPARHRLALLLAWQGRFAEARVEIRRALHSDPLSTVTAASAGWIEYFAGNHEDAIAIERRLLRDDPDAAPALVPLALALTAADRAAEAVAVLRPGSESAAASAAARRIGAADGGSPLLGVLAYVLGRAGLREEAAALIDQLAGAAAHVSPYVMARAWLGMDQHDRALRELQRAYVERAPQLVYLATDPAFEPVRADPTVQRILSATGGPSSLRPPVRALPARRTP